MESRSMSDPFRLRPLRWADARVIGGWRYEAPYDIYNLGHVYMFSAALLRRLGVFSGTEIEFFGVWSEAGELAGLFTFTKRGKGVTLGLAMRPDLTGKGYGLAFVQAGMDFARQRYSPQFFRLDVAAFNQRAIKVYIRAGFMPRGKSFQMKTRHGRRWYLEMTRDA